ncbi:hypothetical protein F2Q68_00043445 [Brassica cretica]|uniref:F-box protein At3g26010-like beta-propeller domain-containing protein n=1 Tax=Brassica cretica TaxID=69181 RepID=A0A8S9LM25_BRACR|nr:hypothetical protein F2Q68_00043445 [Brassica cretica]
MLYVWDKRHYDATGPGVLVSHDFYAGEDNDQCRIMPLPVPDNKYVRRCLTTSGGDVVYLEVLYQRLKVWKLKSNNNSDGEWWQLTSEEIDMGFVGVDVDCFLWELTRLTLIWSIYGEGHKSLLFIRNRRLGVMVKDLQRGRQKQSSVSLRNGYSNGSRPTNDCDDDDKFLLSTELEKELFTKEASESMFKLVEDAITESRGLSQVPRSCVDDSIDRQNQYQTGGVNFQRKTIDIKAHRGHADLLPCQLPPFSIRVVVTLQLPNLQSSINVDNIST